MGIMNYKIKYNKYSLINTRCSSETYKSKYYKYKNKYLNLKNQIAGSAQDQKKIQKLRLAIREGQSGNQTGTFNPTVTTQSQQGQQRGPPQQSYASVVSRGPPQQSQDPMAGSAQDQEKFKALRLANRVAIREGKINPFTDKNPIHNTTHKHLSCKLKQPERTHWFPLPCRPYLEDWETDEYGNTCCKLK